MTTLATIRIDIRTSNPMNGAQGRTRGAMLAKAAERKKLRALAKYQMMVQHQRQLTGPTRITVTRVAPRKLDAWDGLGSALKAIVDGIADYFGVRDDDKRLEWKLDQRRGRVREYAVEIEVEPKVAGEFGETIFASGEALPAVAPIGRLVGKDRCG